jgi:hypothetical protein
VIGSCSSRTFASNAPASFPLKAVESLATYRQHVNAWVLHLRDSIWDRDNVRDATADLMAAQDSSPDQQ